MSGELCGARKTDGSGETCRHAAGWGTPYSHGPCRKHGGNTRNHKVAAQRREAEQAVATYGLPRDVDPHDALLEEVHRTAGHVAWLGGLVAELDRGELTQFVPVGEGGGKVEASVWVELYQRERDHLRKVAADAIRAGVEERRVRLAEREATVVVEAVARALDDERAALTDGQQAALREAVAREFRAIGQTGEVGR